LTIKSPAKPQSPDSRLLWFVIVAAAAARLTLLAAYPLMDTTEARYAEIGRRMAELGDWVTPWIGQAEPFWGKPPLSFWMTAASFKFLGISEFTARLPHWFFGGLLVWITWSWLARRSRREAHFALALMTGSVLVFVASGAVMTDMALALGMMLVMRGFWLALHGTPAERHREQGLMFLGMAIGLLAKGPITVLAGIPIAIWTLWTGQFRRVLQEIRWVQGLLLVLVVVVPWYVLAESRTPGFLEYFLVGEHWQRFIDPGWQGDLYGSAHSFPHGTIWLFAVVAFLPWSVLLPVAAWKWRRAASPAAPEDRSLRVYLLLWVLTPCVIFSAAGNILWTYVLPGLPPLAMLAALWLNRLSGSVRPERLLAAGVAATALVSIAVVTAFNLGGWDDRKSAKALVSDYESRRTAGEALVFFRNLPLSGSFYTAGRAEFARGTEDLRLQLARGPAFVVIKANHLNRVPDSLLSQFRLVGQRGDYRLFLGTLIPADALASQAAGKKGFEPGGVPSTAGR
jgi:4-amino-4-deoxy-L-arabinose transferase-like glycosyltransferase